VLELHSHADLQSERIYPSSWRGEDRRGIARDLVVDREVPLYYGIRRESVEQIRSGKPLESGPLESLLETEIDVGARRVLPIAALLEENILALDRSEKRVIERTCNRGASNLVTESRGELEYRSHEVPHGEAREGAAAETINQLAAQPDLGFEWRNIREVPALIDSLVGAHRTSG